MCDLHGTWGSGLRLGEKKDLESLVTLGQAGLPLRLLGVALQTDVPAKLIQLRPTSLAQAVLSMPGSTAGGLCRFCTKPQALSQAREASL